jgi:hypothetical protein
MCGSVQTPLSLPATCRAASCAKFAQWHSAQAARTHSAPNVGVTEFRNVQLCDRMMKHKLTLRAPGLPIQVSNVIDYERFFPSRYTFRLYGVME